MKIDELSISMFLDFKFEFQILEVQESSHVTVEVGKHHILNLLTSDSFLSGNYPCSSFFSFTLSSKSAFRGIRFLPVHAGKSWRVRANRSRQYAAALAS